MFMWRAGGRDYSPGEEHFPWLCNGEGLGRCEEWQEDGDWMRGRLVRGDFGEWGGNELCWTMLAIKSLVSSLRSTKKSSLKNF